MGAGSAAAGSADEHGLIRLGLAGARDEWLGAIDLIYAPEGSGVAAAADPAPILAQWARLLRPTGGILLSWRGTRGGEGPFAGLTAFEGSPLLQGSELVVADAAEAKGAGDAADRSLQHPALSALLAPPNNTALRARGDAIRRSRANMGVLANYLAEKLPLKKGFALYHGAATRGEHLLLAERVAHALRVIELVQLEVHVRRRQDQRRRPRHLRTHGLGGRQVRRSGSSYGRLGWCA